MSKGGGQNVPMPTEALSDLIRSTEAAIEAPATPLANVKQSRWRAARKILLPDDNVASVFREMWQAFLKAPLWRKPFLAVVLLFGISYHALTLIKVYGTILLLVLLIVMVPIGLVFAAVKAVLWVLRFASGASG